MKPRAPRSLKSRALQFLAQREHSRTELRRKLLVHALADDRALLGAKPGGADVAVSPAEGSLPGRAARRSARDGAARAPRPARASEAGRGLFPARTAGRGAVASADGGAREAVETSDLGDAGDAADAANAADAADAGGTQDTSEPGDVRGASPVEAGNVAVRAGGAAAAFSPDGAVVVGAAGDDAAGGLAADANRRVDDVLDWLTAHRFLSDERFAESRIHAREARYGDLRIRNELKQHGVALGADAARALRESESSRAWALWQRRFGVCPVTMADLSRQARFLTGRGFSPDVVRQVLRRARAVPTAPETTSADD